VLSSLCLKGAKVQGGGGENNNDHRLSFLSFIGITKAKNKRHENNTKLSSSCLKGMRIGATKAKKKKTQR
jgi:hypothetical protein